MQMEVNCCVRDKMMRRDEMFRRVMRLGMETMPKSEGADQVRQGLRMGIEEAEVKFGCFGPESEIG